MKKILVAIGTRPEGIKMMPIIKALQSTPEFQVSVCSTGQHRVMLERVLGVFGIQPDIDLNVMTENQTLTGLSARILQSVEAVFDEQHPDLVMVQGDTTSVVAVALAAFNNKIPVAHLEAGLRSGSVASPWPEEMNRQITSRIAAIHFAPTELARDNLLRENINTESIFVTGNTVVDAILLAIQVMDSSPAVQQQMTEQFSFLDRNKQFILVTGHRRENFGDGMKNICRAIRRIAQRNDIELVYPVHLNPNVQKPVKDILGDCKNVHLIEPLDYLSFLYLMRSAYIILTDSGGVQEEAPSLGKPVIVMRDTTERPEAMYAGTSVLAGSGEESIVENVVRLLDNADVYQQMSRVHYPYGDGTTSQKIVEILKRFFNVSA